MVVTGCRANKSCSKVGGGGGGARGGQNRVQCVHDTEFLTIHINRYSLVGIILYTFLS